MTALRENPFMYCGKWHWYDETGTMSVAYSSQRDALYALLKYMDSLEGEIPWWKQWWGKLKGFWNDTRG